MFKQSNIVQKWELHSLVQMQKVHMSLVNYNFTSPTPITIPKYVQLTIGYSKLFATNYNYTLLRC